MEKEIFMQVLAAFQRQYPSRKIELDCNLIYIDGELKFNIKDYCLLYNLKRLCDCLEDELR